MQMGKPAEIRVHEGTPQRLEELMKTAKQHGAQFLFFVQSTHLKLHGERWLSLFSAMN
jgi:hypothetical protein